MCAARMPDVSWPGQPVVATLPLATPAAAPVRRVVTAQASATIPGERVVTEDIPQNSWAPMAITSSSLAPVSPIAVAHT
jgi:hypothetical protein